MRVLSSSLYKYTTFCCEIQIVLTFATLLEMLKCSDLQQLGSGVCYITRRLRKRVFGCARGERRRWLIVGYALLRGGNLTEIRLGQALLQGVELGGMDGEERVVVLRIYAYGGEQ